MLLLGQVFHPNGSSFYRENFTYTPRLRLFKGARAFRIFLVAAGVSLVFFASSTVFAHETAQDEQSWNGVDDGHHYLSDTVEDLALRLDAFFGGERTYEEATGSYMKIGSGVTWSEGGLFDYEFDLRIKLNLPNTRNRFKLILDTAPDEEDKPNDDGELPTPESTVSEAVDNTYQLALRYLAKASETARITADAGVHLSGMPNPFVRLRGRRSFIFDGWGLRGIEKLEYSMDNHFESTTTLELDFALTDRLLYRNYATAKFGSDEDTFELSAGMLLAHSLSNHDALIYQVGVKGESHPVTCANEYLAAITYRRRIYRKWLFASLAPALSWAREDNFSPVTSLTFKIDIICGSSTVE